MEAKSMILAWTASAGEDCCWFLLHPYIEFETLCSLHICSKMNTFHFITNNIDTVRV